MTSRFSHLASMDGSDYLELVWRNGQICVQGHPASRRYSINLPRSEAYEEDAWLNTSYPLLEFPVQGDSADLHSSHQNSHQFDFLYSKSKSSSKHEDECAKLRTGKESKHTGGAHRPATTGNSKLCTSSSQQCLPSAPLKTPRMTSSQTPTTLIDGMPIPNSLKQDLGSDQTTGKLKSTCESINGAVLTRVEEIEAGKNEKPAGDASSKGPDHSVAMDSAKGSHDLIGLQEKTRLTAYNKESQELVPDKLSEAVGSHKYNPTSSPAIRRATGKPDTKFCNESSKVASSSVCSLGFSNDPTYLGPDDSTHLSDNDEDPEDILKGTPAREGTRAKRSRNAEIRNLSEKKRRDKINKKIRALEELIPNCNKMDKASTLDDAIAYLKTLKLQLQIMSMGTGLCMPLTMLPAGTHHLPQLMGLRPGSSGIPCGLPQFPIPQLPGITDTRLQMLGFPNQVLPLPISQVPFIPMLGKPSTQPLVATSCTGTNLAQHLASPHLTTLDYSVSKDSDLNPHAEGAIMQGNQGTK